MLFVAHVLPFESAACATPHTRALMDVAVSVLSSGSAYTQPQGTAGRLMSCEPPMSAVLGAPEEVSVGSIEPPVQ